jgi:hypothetical protein
MNDARGTYIRDQGVKDLITKNFHERSTMVGIDDPFRINTLTMESKRSHLKT